MVRPLFQDFLVTGLGLDNIPGLMGRQGLRQHGLDVGRSCFGRAEDDLLCQTHLRTSFCGSGLVGKQAFRACGGMVRWRSKPSTSAVKKPLTRLRRARSAAKGSRASAVSRRVMRARGKNPIALVEEGAGMPGAGDGNQTDVGNRVLWLRLRLPLGE